MSEVSIKETLIKTRELLAQPSNWQQQGYGKESCFCLVGAIGAALGEPPVTLFDHPILAALVIAGEIEGKHDADILVFNWNDEPDRKHDDILALLDKAIENAN